MSAFPFTALSAVAVATLAGLSLCAAPLAARAQDTPLQPGTGTPGSTDFVPYSPGTGGTSPGLSPLSPTAPMNLQDPNATPSYTPGTETPHQDQGTTPAPGGAAPTPELETAVPSRSSEDAPIKPKATVITSRHFSRDPSRGKSVFDGKVIVQSADFQVQADRVEISFDINNPARITGMTCTGGVIVRQPLSNSWADRLDYDMVAKTAVLSGNAIVKEATRTITGKKVYLDTKTGKSIIEGRKTIIISPPAGSEGKPGEMPSIGGSSDTKGAVKPKR
ncbi:MAG: LptA/OstA family protein [Candidatus Methylacidiphilales bacterium]|nr:LptA/OstA family protein [Candidatus Methylacidiphilales bacterium]